MMIATACESISVRRQGLALILLLALSLPGHADGERAAYRATFGPDATLGLWSVWEVAQNEYLLTASLQPEAGPSPAIRLYNLEFSWDALRLAPVGVPVAGTLFAGEPGQWFGYFDEGATRTVTQTLLGDVPGVIPGGTVVLFSQLFHASGPTGGTAVIDLVTLTLRGPDNEEISVLADDEVDLALDVTPPQGFLFDIVALNPAGNQVWTAQTLVASTLAAGDGSLAQLILNESALPPDNTNPAWVAPPAPATTTLSSGNGLKTVRAWLRDHYGNRLAVSDQITLDTQSPTYHVTQLEARPRHQGALVTWSNPIAPDFNRVRLYRRGWSDDGLSRYPEYDDIDPMDAYPATEAAALGAGFVLAYEGAGESWLDPVIPRDVYRYVAFCLDHAGNVGPGHASARDRCTNYRLGDTRPTWDGIVFVQDLVHLAGSYSTAEGEVGYQAGLDYGPTDDHGREGIPLTDNLVGFEDLMIFAMNYGPFGPALATHAPRQGAPSATDETLRLVLENSGSRVLLRLEGPAGWLGLHLLLRWDDPGEAVVLRHAGDAVILQASPGHLLLDRVLLPGEDPALALAELDFGLDGPPHGLRVEELELRDGANRPLPVSGSQAPLELPDMLDFMGAFPNPFNPETLLRFTLPRTAEVRLTVYNALGQVARRLDAGRLEAGAHRLRLTGEGLASGVYLLDLQAGGERRVQRAVLLR